MSETTGQEVSLARGRYAQRARRWLSLAVLVLGLCGFISTIVFGSRASATSVESNDQAVIAGLNPASVQGAAGDFSKFSHTHPAHARLTCLLCHRRESNAPQPRLPGHTPCAGCHAQEFANSSSPICTICHTDVGSGAVKNFPPLRSFNVRFDHAQHTGIRPTQQGCTSCHRPERRGVALSIPAGLSAHSTCYQCHQPRAQSRSGNDISSCSTCHAPGRHARTPETARAFRVNFSHSEHGPRQKLGCADCHNIRAGAAQGRQVTAPTALMHHAAPRAQSCMTCHNDRRAFGIADFANCKRCHEGTTFRF